VQSVYREGDQTVRKFRIQLARLRGGGMMHGVYELQLPLNMGVQDRYISIDVAMQKAGQMIRQYEEAEEAERVHTRLWGRPRG
jgi:hypothetical protein